MVKVLLISLSVFIAVVTGGYCIAWYSEASQLKNGIEETITKINAEQKYITYAAIETSGFPSDLYVSIIKPHFTGRIDQLFKALAAKSHTPQPANITSMPEWNEDIQLDGRITIGINALSDHYTLRLSGNWQRNTTINNQKISVTSQSSGDTLCILQMTRSGNIFNNLWDYHALIRDNGKDFLKDLRLFDCSGQPNIIADTTSHEQMMSNGPWRFYVTGEPKGAEQQFRFYMKITDIEVTPQGDAMMALQRTTFSPNFSYPVKYSLFGKQNMEIDFSYAGPADWKPDDKNPPIDIALSKFDLNNQLYTSTATFFLNNGMNDTNRTARLAFKGEDNVSEAYDAFLQEMVHNIIAQVYADKTQPQFAWAQPYLQKYTAEEMYGILGLSIPKLHPLGKMVQSLDVSYLGAPDFSTGDVTLSDLEISTSPYGIKGNGGVKRVAGQPLPAGHATLTCSNCTRLVDDVIDYASRLQKTVSYFQTPEQLAASTPINSRLAEGIKGFLKALAAPVKDSDPDKNAFVYAHQQRRSNRRYH